MAVRHVHVLLISLLLYELAFGDYCKNGYNSSIQFCQRGTISGSKLYINGSSMKTRKDLMDRGCVCYLEHNRNGNILVNSGDSCVLCGLAVKVGNSNLTGRWAWGLLNDTKFTMTLGLYGNTSINTAFCITIEENVRDSSVVLNLTCEELVARPSIYTSTSPNGITTTTTMVPDTTKGLSPTSSKTALPLNTETTNPTAVIAGNTNGTHGPNANDTYRVATTTTTKTTITTTTGNDPGESGVDKQKEVIIPAAAGGGAGVLVILAIVIVVCCLRKKRKHADDPIYMKEYERSDAIMTDNAAYGIYIDTNTNPVPHVQANCTGDVYAVVNKEGTSNVCPSVEVLRMQVGETGDVYAIVNKTTVRDIPNIEHSREISAKSRIQI